jgi:hypothetical protein
VTKISKRDMILLAVIGAVVILGGFYWLAIKPAKADLATQKTQLSQIRDEAGQLRDTLSRADNTPKTAARQVSDRLRLAKAVPDDVQTPGVVVELQQLADRANVQLTSIKTNDFSDYGSLRGTEFSLVVTGRFFDVDDFLYRLHHQVTVNAKDQPQIRGRLFATKSVDLTLLPPDDSSNGGPVGADDQVTATVVVVAFSSIDASAATTASGAGGAAVSTAAPTTSVAGAAEAAAPATGAATGSASEPQTPSPAGTTTTTTTSTGGTQ